MNRQTYRLFFALRPPESRLADIAAATEAIKAAKSVRGSWVKPAQYHITLHFLGDYRQPPEEIIKRAQAAAESVRCAPFDVVLDSVSSFRGRLRSPCVLRCAKDADAALQLFWRELGRTLVMHGLDEHLERRFTPHLTIAYGDNALGSPVAVTPIAWKAADFVLIVSLVGKTIHNVLGSWILSD
jgi:2'-5' RNA ligase